MKSILKFYLVGGAVRDLQLGLEPKDKDYVVVGSSTNKMLELGFIQVGKDFPVFLHPETNEEYALARTESKKGLGYSGFDVKTENVSLEQDLYRRDITINSMAIDLNSNQLIDPFNGLSDLKNKLIRHTSSHFIEDPLRVLRVIRFKSNYRFDIHQSTIELMKSIPKEELKSIHPNRILKELYKLNNTENLKDFLITLNKLELFSVFFPNIDFTKINFAIFESLSKNNDSIYTALPFVFYNANINGSENSEFLDNHQLKLSKLLINTKDHSWSSEFIIKMINKYRLTSNLQLLSNFCQFCNYSNITLCSFNTVLNAINSVRFTEAELKNVKDINKYKTSKILDFLNKR